MEQKQTWKQVADDHNNIVKGVPLPDLDGFCNPALGMQDGLRVLIEAETPTRVRVRVTNPYDPEEGWRFVGNLQSMSLPCLLEALADVKGLTAEFQFADAADGKQNRKALRLKVWNVKDSSFEPKMLEFKRLRKGAAVVATIATLSALEVRTRQRAAADKAKAMLKGVLQSLQSLLSEDSDKDDSE